MRWSPLQSETFCGNFPFSESPILRHAVDTESLVIDLLAGRSPGVAGDFFLSWAERRSSSWADAARDASTRAATNGHLPQIRGQLRFHRGEIALAEAARAANAGIIPMPTVQPGATFVVARVGRFGLVSLMVRDHRKLPRRAVTRRLLSQPNQEIDPQQSLLRDGLSARGATELAYFGCVVAVPSSDDPSVPSELAIGVPNAAVTDWIAWMPLHRVHAMLNDRAAGGGTSAEPPAPKIEDRRFPTFRLPKKDDDAKDEGGA
jgi:hypothetical protein